MPHLITNRARQHNLMSDHPAGHLHFTWESVNAILYLIGGFTFIIGSIFFLPAYERLITIGVLLYFCGSFLYVVVTVHDLFESINHLKCQDQIQSMHLFELFAATLYTSGTLLFIVGSLLFLPQVDLIAFGAWCFIVGSTFFSTGAFINILQIVQAGSLLTLQLLNATAICFVVGSILFLVASIPYLWKIVDPQIKNDLFTYVAWEYIVGSLLFFTGGVFNYYRIFEATSHYRTIAFLESEAGKLE